jgi:hypothetical protein
MFDAVIAFSAGVLATYYGWRPIPAGPRHLEWAVWDQNWGRVIRIAGPLLIASSLLQALFR